ncbi:hypothetical protein AXG93_977s1040 [Marchantia polymorpha subsp. ruderalis]|uniref:Uncharacterized protein n=1 Tax=Marchantia polymorpha subsp. ruderalis TaxID=1480154 RepID=A0A176WDS9_MARPO|nr:hypothetical protein AXG93_977s1040 [Marchantia polymorpha subsp. ruderalis]
MYVAWPVKGGPLRWQRSREQDDEEKKKKKKLRARGSAGGVRPEFVCCLRAAEQSRPNAFNRSRVESSEDRVPHSAAGTLSPEPLDSEEFVRYVDQ